MNILIINHYVGGLHYGMEYRPYYLAQEWIKQGHNVTFVGASFSHLRLQQPKVKGNCFIEEIDEIKYIWLKTPVYKSGFQRIKNIISFIRKLYKYSKRIVNEISPDVVIASSTYPLDIYPSRMIAKLSSAKLIYEVHDLWPLSPMLIGGYCKWHPFIMVMQKAENDAYRFSDKVISLLWNAKGHMIEYGMDEDKFVCIPNGYCTEEWNDKNIVSIPNEHKELYDRLKKSNKIVVGFAGGFAASGALSTLINAAVLLKENSDIVFTLVGKGPEKENLIAIVKKYNLTNVFFLPSVSKNQIPNLDAIFDIAYLGGVHSILHKYGTSANKLTDYMLCGKPIVFSVDEPNSLVERVGCGIQVEAENSKKVADAILKLIELGDGRRVKMGNKGKNYAIENLKYSILAEKFISVLS